MAKPKVPTDPSMTPEVRSFLEDLQSQADTSTNGKAGKTQTEYVSGIIANVTAKDYRIVESIPYAVTITGFTAKTASGTATAKLFIGTTSIVGGSLSVTSSASSTVPTSANSMAAGDVLIVTPSSVSSALDMSFAVKYTRTLDA